MVIWQVYCFYISNIFNFFIYTEEARMYETFVITWATVVAGV